MNKFQKIQKWLSFIPYYSTIFIAIVTYIVLYKNKAKAKQWLTYGITCGVSIAIVFILNKYILTGEHIVLNIVTSGLLLCLTNFVLVDLQRKSQICLEKANETEFSVSVEEDSKSDSKKGGIVNNLKKHKIIVIILCVIVAVIILFIAIIVRMVSLYDNGQIEDINGEKDYSLATITQEQINGTKYGDYSIFMAASSHYGEKSDVNDRRFKDVDYTQTTLSAKSFSGIRIINATQTESESLSFEIKSEVISGNLAIMVYIDNLFYTELDINCSDRVEITDVSGKLVTVKAIGESANVSIEVEREIKD